jgi:hypothetical protein
MVKLKFFFFIESNLEHKMTSLVFSFFLNLSIYFYFCRWQLYENAVFVVFFVILTFRISWWFYSNLNSYWDIHVEAKLFINYFYSKTGNYISETSIKIKIKVHKLK